MFAVSFCKVFPDSVESFLEFLAFKKIGTLLVVKNISGSFVKIKYDIESILFAPFDTVFYAFVSEFHRIFVFILYNIIVNRETYVVNFP